MKKKVISITALRYTYFVCMLSKSKVKVGETYE